MKYKLVVAHLTNLHHLPLVFVLVDLLGSAPALRWKKVDLLAKTVGLRTRREPLVKADQCVFTNLTWLMANYNSHFIVACLACLLICVCFVCDEWWNCLESMCENFLAKMFDKIYFIFIKYMEYSFMRKVHSPTNLNEMLIYQTS